MYEEMFGLVFCGVLAVSTIYAVGRTIYERWIKKIPPSGDQSPTGIPFHAAVRLANSVFHERFNRERDTQVIVLPLNADGTLAEPEPGNPGASTVDVQGRRQPGHHRAKIIGCARVTPRVPEAA